MRKLTLEQIQARVRETPNLDMAVFRFRQTSKLDGWHSKRTRIRHSDEIQALNMVARKNLLTSIKEGKVHYDPERRVLYIEQYSKGL